MKFLYNEKRAILEQGCCHLNTWNEKKSHFIRFPGGSKYMENIYNDFLFPS